MEEEGCGEGEQRTDERRGGGTVDGAAVEDRHEARHELVRKRLARRQHVLTQHPHELQTQVAAQLKSMDM